MEQSAHREGKTEHFSQAERQMKAPFARDDNKLRGNESGGLGARTSSRPGTRHALCLLQAFPQWAEQ